MITNSNDLTVELRSADGTSMEFYQTDEERVREVLRLLSAPRLFAQPHLLLTSRSCASMIPCKGIDMILARTAGPMPLKFPVNLPIGQFDLVEQPEASLPDESTATEESHGHQPGQLRRHDSRVEIRTVGGWTVSLKTVAVIRGNVLDERQFFSNLPEVPTIPFRLQEGGIGLINTANITRASAWPKPAAIPGTPLPLMMRQRSPASRSGYALSWTL
jgi:hypothetical protein